MGMEEKSGSGALSTIGGLVKHEPELLQSKTGQATLSA
jgi:hypothetical protein